jgi:hypothetical protein
MVNVELDRLLADRDKQVELADSIMGLAEGDGGRDLVKAERDNLAAIRGRIGELDEQIGPLAEFETMRESAAATAARKLGRPDAQPTTGQARPGGSGAAFPYRSAGHYMVDLVRSRDPQADPAQRAAAAERVVQARAVANQITDDTPGVLPVPVVGPIIDTVDATRPFVTSIGPKDMGNTFGEFCVGSGVANKNFHRSIPLQCHC